MPNTGNAPVFISLVYKVHRTDLGNNLDYHFFLPTLYEFIVLAAGLLRQPTAANSPAANEKSG